MPYLSQSRSREVNLRKRVLRLSGDPASLNRIADGDGTARGSVVRDTIYGYRDRGISDTGQSLNYEDLTGEQLRNEVRAEGHRTSQYDTGHPCKISHDWVDMSGAYSTLGLKYGTRSGSHSNYFYGTVKGFVDPFATYLPADPGWMSTASINSWGTRALNAFRPNHAELAGLFTSLVELRRDGLPAMPSVFRASSIRNTSKSFSTLVRANSEEFLNAKFGWAPMVSDLQGLAEAYLKGHEVIRRFEERSGIAVRRSGVLDVSSSTSSGNKPTYFVFPRWVDPTGGVTSTRGLHTSYQGGTMYYTDNVNTTVRFVGSFQYQLENLSKSWGAHLAKAERLLGLELTPETLWETAPWTWLLDWWSNFGGILSWFSDAERDHMVLRYGYIIVDTMSTRSASLRIPLLDGSAFTSVMNAHSTRYERVRANPYGFGIDTNALSNTQWAILGALGMTRAPKVLRLND